MVVESSGRRDVGGENRRLIIGYRSFVIMSAQTTTKFNLFFFALR